MAHAIGPTDVHVVNHHGSIDPESEIFLTTLRSPVMILPSWSPTHPSQDALKRMERPPARRTAAKGRLVIKFFRLAGYQVSVARDDRRSW